MNLDRLQVTLKPRTPWQAMDLGLRVCRHFYIPLFSISMVMVTVLTVLFYTITFNSWVTLGLLFWFKPIVERPILYYLSRSIFSDEPKLLYLVSQIRHIVFRQGLKTFTYRRLNLSRSFNDPVVFLEGLDKEARTKRLQVLHQIDNGSSWLGVLCIHLEALIQSTLFLIPFFLLPGWAIDWVSNEIPITNSAFAFETVTLLTYMIAISFVAPLYVSCGFMLYLNSRTKLEAWHLELGFKKIVSRFNSYSCSVIFAVLLFSVPNESSMAETNVIDSEEKEIEDTISYPRIDNDAAQQLQKTLQNILNSEIFGKHYQEKEYEIDWNLDWDWDWGDQNKELNSKNNEYPWLKAIQDMASYLKYFIILCLALLLIYVLYKFRFWQYFKSFAHSNKHSPTTIMGMNIDKASLPSNVYDIISTHIENHELREALSLMLRCHISQAINRHNIALKSSHTEQECLSLISLHSPKDETRIFSHIIQLWLSHVYAHEIIKAEEVNVLFKNWYPLVKEYLQK